MKNLTATICLTFALLVGFVKSGNAEQKFNLLTFNVDEIKKTIDDPSKVRFAFLDLSKHKKRIVIRIIDFWGNTKNSIHVPEKILDRDRKNYRWGAALQYESRSNTFLLGLWGSGIYRFSEDGTIIKKYNYPNITHSIEVSKNGNIMFPFSWSNRNENQITEIDSFGSQVWQWRAQDFIDEEDPGMTISAREPDSFVAITGAVPLDERTVIATLSQANRLIFIERHTGKVKSQISAIRPHTPVVQNGKLVAYTSRRPNSLHLWSEGCRCFNDIEFLDDNAQSPGGKERWARSLSLQFIGKDHWFASGITSLRQISADGREIWHLQISPSPQWTGFHKIIRYVAK